MHRSSRTLVVSLIAVSSVACSGGVSHPGASDGSGADGVGGGPGVGATGPSGPGSAVGGTGVGASGVGGSGGECAVPDDCAFLNGACTEGVCSNGVCVSVAVNEAASCDDFLFCTTGETCSGGICGGGASLACPGTGEPCLVAACDEGTQSCSIVPGNEGDACDDADACTTSSFCVMGKCLPDAGADCSFLDDQCQLGTCDPMGGCVAVPTNEGALCDDGLFCTVEESCQMGSCAGGKPMSCATPGGCSVSSCDEASDQCIVQPGNDGAACDDGNTCTSGSICSGGVCSGGMPANEGRGCDDGNACTTGDVCEAGVCQGDGPITYFNETFASNAQKWTFGPEWQIGSAKASLGGVWGADPATDHTSTADNGVAGIVIGGNAATIVHPPTWLTSPAFDTSGATGPVIVSYYRWLNSDYEPYMTNRVEVWNGTAWVLLWKSGGPPGMQDSPPMGQGWTYMQHDVTAFKNAAMMVRFGMSVGSAGAYQIGSWNLDDVLVASAPCP